MDAANHCGSAPDSTTHPVAKLQPSKYFESLLQQCGLDRPDDWYVQMSGAKGRPWL